MTAPDPVPDVATYVSAAVLLYVELPETPLSASIRDQWQVRRLHERGVPLRLVESALLLASLRRMVRSADLPPLIPIRSLSYFLPVIDELLTHPMPDNYLEYLQIKLRRISGANSHPGESSKKDVSA
jgi:hypothetical protein